MGEVTKKPNVLSSEECEKMIFLRCSRFADAHYFPGGASIEECKNTKHNILLELIQMLFLCLLSGTNISHPITGERQFFRI